MQQVSNIEDVHRLYGDRVHHLLVRLVGESDAEDLKQTVFLKVTASWHTFKGNSTPSTWIYRIATNVALDRLRGRATREKALPELVRLAEDLGAEVGRLEPSAEQLVAQKQMHDCIHSLIKTLPLKDQTVLVLADMEGFSTEEVASILEISPGAAKIRLHRARTRLRAIMGVQCQLSRDSRNVLVCDRIQIAPKRSNQPRECISWEAHPSKG